MAELEPTVHLRWFPVPGGMNLEQLWSDGYVMEWRLVPVFTIEQVKVADPKKEG